MRLRLVSVLVLGAFGVMALVASGHAHAQTIPTTPTTRPATTTTRPSTTTAPSPTGSTTPQATSTSKPKTTTTKPPTTTTTVSPTTLIPPPQTTIPAGGPTPDAAAGLPSHYRRNMNPVGLLISLGGFGLAGGLMFRRWRQTRAD